MVKVFSSDLRILNTIDDIQKKIDAFTPRNMVPISSSTADCNGLLVITVTYKYEHDGGEGDY